ncbi:MAG: hypothetical protein AAF192_06255 [Pseudomonadota bacterium]
MRDRVFIIGWGSLIWDLDDLAPKVEGAWRMGAGPRVPLEFSRVSVKRRMGLAVCIDVDHGAPCPTHVIASRRDDPFAAREDLAARERAPTARIGVWCARSRRGDGRSAELVAAWCEGVGAAGAVWTDLTANYAEHHPQGFSLDHAEAYLAGLRGESRDEAVRYIENAPAGTDTPLRRRLAARAWWRAEAARVAALDAGRRSGAGLSG